MKLRYTANTKTDRKWSIEDAMLYVMNPSEYYEPDDRNQHQHEAMRSVMAALVERLHDKGIVDDEFVLSLVSPYYVKAEEP